MTNDVLHLLYILTFTLLAILAAGNLIRNLMALGRAEARRNRPAAANTTPSSRREVQPVLHPEMLDDSGNAIREPLLVMKSMTVDDARSRLQSLYDESPDSGDDSLSGSAS